MKHIVLLLSIQFVIGSVFHVYAQEEITSEKLNRTVVSLSPFNLIASQFQIGVEKDFRKGTNSIMMLGSIIINNNRFFGLDPEFGLQAELQYRPKFIHSVNPQRKKTGRNFQFDFYAGPYAQYQYLRSADSYFIWDPVTQTEHFIEERLNFYSVGGGVILGTRYIFMDRISLDVYLGGGIKYTFNGDSFDPNITSGGTGIFAPALTGIIPKGNIQIGVAF